ncbi:MAG: hypothetical protein LH469_01850 [Frankiaceae bacterium]|nr:hypothetical protein [Frankiaceae bacterium]
MVDRAEEQHERVTTTRDRRAAAVLISPHVLAELEEALSVLADPQCRDAGLQREGSAGRGYRTRARWY